MLAQFLNRALTHHTLTGLSLLWGFTPLPKPPIYGLFGNRADSQTKTKFTRQSDVIYGRKFGVALTMEVFTPATRNSLGVLWIVSSSGVSSRERTLQDTFERRISPLLEHGYTVFAVIHGSAPIFNMQDMVSDIRRAVRFVRYRAADCGERINFL